MAGAGVTRQLQGFAKTGSLLFLSNTGAIANAGQSSRKFFEGLAREIP
jgi:hypothetical protein